MLRSLAHAGGRKYAASIAIVIGMYFLLKNFNLIPDGWDIGNLWPLLLIVPGILLLFEKDTKHKTGPGTK